MIVEHKTPIQLSLEGVERKKSPMEIAEDIEDPETLCGIGKWKPRFLQVFGNIKAFVASFSLALILTQTTVIYLVSQITTIEKYFGISSFVSGFLAACNDIGFMVFVLFTSHIGRYSHIPRVLGCAVVLYSISALMASLSYFVSKPSDSDANSAPGNQSLEPMSAYFCHHSENGNKTIQAETGDDECSMGVDEPTGPGFAISLLAVGMVLQGLAKTPRTPLSTTYIDDNVKKTDTGIYVGILTCFQLAGPAVAFTLGSVFSKIYIDLTDPVFGVRDPRWIGAWWLGFIAFGTLGFLTSVPLFLFPRRMRDAPVKNKGEKQPNLDSKLSLRQKLKVFLPGLARILKVPTNCCAIIAASLRLFSAIGAITFSAKYVEVHFTVPTWKTNLLLGSTKMVACALGTVTAGIITSRLKLGVVGCAKMIATCILISAGVNAIMMMISCPQVRLTGSDIYKGVETSIVQLGTVAGDCIASCQCKNSSIFPVCGSDGINYASPCHAGCTMYTQQGFADCACVGEWKNGTVSTGYCADSSCGLLTVFLVFLVLSSFTACLCIVPTYLLIIRAVSEKDKALATGVLVFATSIIGFTFGPIVFGWLIDKTCLFWETTCGKTGSCTVYDIQSFRYTFFGLITVVDVMCAGLYMLCVYLAHGKQPGLGQSDKIDKKDDNKEQIRFLK